MKGQFGDLRYTADLLGPAKIQTTMIYTESKQEEIDNKYLGGAHPFAFMNGHQDQEQE